MNTTKRNLISKRVGIGDHMPSNKFTRVIFANADEYIDTISNDDKDNTGKCIKNQYVNDEWLKAWIKCDVNKLMGKTNSFYVYNVDYDGTTKPLHKYFDDENVLYRYANGVMYYDFDHIGVETVDVIRECFVELSKHVKYMQWFETSWSGHGCHIRMNFDLVTHTKKEWMFLYMNNLDLLMKRISQKIDVSEWYTDNTIDWSCASIMRGFAVPYNEDGVIINNIFDNKINEYDNPEELQWFAEMCIPNWNEKITEKFYKKIDMQPVKPKQFKSVYKVKNIDDTNVIMQQGEKFDYNWRLMCVTALMSIYDNDKEKVRKACAYIYQYISPYKNHTYDEMLNDELENKIFRNGDMTLSPSNEILYDLQHYFGFEFEKHKTTNKVYLSEFHKNILQTL